MIFALFQLQLPCHQWIHVHRRLVVLIQYVKLLVILHHARARLNILVLHQIVDQNALATQNARATWRALTKDVKTRVQAAVDIMPTVK